MGSGVGREAGESFGATVRGSRLSDACVETCAGVGSGAAEGASLPAHASATTPNSVATAMLTDRLDGSFILPRLVRCYDAEVECGLWNGLLWKQMAPRVPGRYRMAASVQTPPLI